ncbi:MAG: AAA family ATPase, partial [Candidatus Omnitrophica bacterium]|nr:AAA family ATPase [Candidatus Omnitrophota bacterium]
MPGQTIANRYKLSEELVSDYLGVLYKAQDLHDNKPVLVSLLSEKSLSRPLEVLLRFKRSAEQVSKLNHPNLLKTISVGEFDSKTYLVHENFDSQVLSSYLNQPQNLSQPWDIDKAVELIFQISSALSVAHEQNILHQSIQPANILISQAQPQSAKLFNFGFSILKDISKITEKEDIISTFGYLSPESSGILRKPIDARSDIYSLGILFYQLLTGRSPYIADDISSLIHQHIAIKPTPPSRLNNQIPPVLDNIILRLIAKEPTERYQSLQGLVHDFKEYQRQRKEGKVLIDFEIARSDRLAQLSFSTKLIGRDKELSQLNELLNKTKQGQGSLALVFGEPGIGKSRLVDELRGSIHSLNGLFCGGKCYQYEFRTPYKVFAEAIDAYIEKIKRLSQKEQEMYIKRIKETLGELGGEVVKISPSLTDLIGTPPKLIELEPEKEKIRFLITVTNFLICLSTVESPLLMFLDDLQWVDDGTLEFLERFAEKLQNTSTLLIVSYRDTEVDQAHPLAQLIEKLKEQNIPLSEIPVKFFTLAETSQMVSQIIMEKEDSVLPLTNELQERAKGNPFFTLELLHSLVDSQVIHLKEDHYVYNLDKLKDVNLPTTIVEAVLSRMKDLSADTLKILSYASVMGKEIDFKLLIELTNTTSEQILSSIEKGIQGQVLYRDLTGKENVFFMHDRIREAFYRRVSEGERIPLHKHIAEIIEEQNKDNIGPVLYDLAYHFTQAKLEDKALQYSMPAADKAKSSYANNLAIDLYNAVKVILESQNKIKSGQYVEVLENLGDAYRLAGKFEESIAVLKTCESLIPAQDKVHKAQVLSRIGDTLFDKGERDESVRTLENALRILSIRFFTSSFGVIIGILKEFIRQMLHTSFSKVFVSNTYKASVKDLIVVRICNRLAHIFYHSNMNKTLYFVFKTLNLSEKIGPCSELAYNYIGIGNVWIAVPWVSRAFRDQLKGLKMAQQLGDRIKEGCGYAYLCYVCYGANEIKRGIEYGEKSINLLKKLGEYWDLGVAYDFTVTGYTLSGQLKRSADMAEEFVTIMKMAGSLAPLGWAYGWKSRVHSLIGDVDTVMIDETKKARELAKITSEKTNMVWAPAMLSLAYLRTNNYDEAILAIEEAAKLFPTHYNKCCWSLELFPIGAQTYLDAVVMNNPSSEHKKHLLKRAKWFCNNAKLWSFLYKYFLGWSYQVNGTYLWLTGKKKKAVKTWEKGLKFLREKTEDKYRIAYILLEEAKFLLQDNPQDKKALGNLLEAKELFSSMGCQLDLKTCNDLLSKIMPSSEGLEGREALTQRRHLESLLSTTRAIGSVFDLDELLNKIMDYAIQVTGAERGFLLLYDDKTGQLTLKLSHGAEGAFSFESYKISLELIKESEKAKDTLIASSEQASIPKIANELKSYNVKQALSAYLTSRDKPIGILYLDNQLSSGTFGKQELELMQSFAVQASVSLENAHLVSDLLDQARLRQELELGREIQMDLLPKVTPTIPGLKLSGLMLPAKEIGGDYYDFLVHKSQPAQGTDSSTAERLSVVIGDVSGKGVAAGLLMAMVKTCLYALNKQPITPKAILLSTN